MDMYIRMYDELKRSEGDNPTIGIVLCSDTDDDIARYSVMHGNEQLFASKYKLYLPTEEELKAEIETQKAMFYLQQQEREEAEMKWLISYVFFIKYLRTLGFSATNDIFAENAWYFRNALVRANYTNLQKGIHETTEYLEAFLRNLLLNEKFENNK